MNTSISTLSGYWQIKVDKQSSNLLTFGTLSDRYRFERLPCEIYSPTEVFQRQVTSIISDIRGSANSQNNFIAWGETLQEHDERLRKIFLKKKKSGLKLIFLGHIISSEGIKIDP